MNIELSFRSKICNFRTLRTTLNKTNFFTILEYTHQKLHYSIMLKKYDTTDNGFEMNE